MSEDDELSKTQIFSKMQIDVGIMQKDIENIKLVLEKLSTALLGDGDVHPGMGRQMDLIKAAISFNNQKGSINERVTSLETQVNEIVNTLNSIRRAAWTLALTFILFLFGFLWSLWTHQISIHIP